MGVDHRLYGWLGRWNARRGTPSAPCWFKPPSRWPDSLVRPEHGQISNNGFEKMVIFTTPSSGFSGAVGIALVVLRKREPDRAGAIGFLGYPVTPLLFCLGCGFMVYSGLAYAIQHRSSEALVDRRLLIGAVELLRRWGAGSQIGINL